MISIRGAETQILPNVVTRLQNNVGSGAFNSKILLESIILTTTKTNYKTAA